MTIDITGKDYVIAVQSDPRSLDEDSWNGLLEQQSSPTPFMRHEYLAALHQSLSAVPETGWAPQFMTVQSNDGLVGACALYLKAHSYGEYVFDWAWADAYARNGLAYYPKLLGAVPFTPVAGSRLLARDELSRSVLVNAISTYAMTNKLSSAHLLFIDDVDRLALENAGWMLRTGVQFHWQQDEQDPCEDFNVLLSRMQRDKRKKIQQDRRKVAEQGIVFTVFEGRAIEIEHWNFFHQCYTLTYLAHHSTPYLTRDFFRRMAASMSDHWVMFVAYRGSDPIATSLIALDRHRRKAWGRYWGAIEAVPCLHFEACYYQPLQWCLENGFKSFEGGAQGEHKMARGLLPVRTTSAHWLRDGRFASAVADFLAGEGAHIDEHMAALHERNPFKATGQNNAE